MLRLCQRLAAEGYAAIAPDLFFRAGGTEARDFATLIGSLDRELTRGDIVALLTIFVGRVPPRA